MPELSPGEVRVWLMEVATPGPAALARWRGVLDPDECARADRFYFDPDRAIFLAAHWLLRTALTEAGPLPVEAWRFVKGRHGKPMLDPELGQPGLRFNLSHTKGLVACAVTTGAELGIDVELITERRAGLDIAGRYFSPAEVALMRSRPREQHGATFFRLWTLKEALIKATGEGLQRPLDSFSFAFDPLRITFHRDAPDASQALRFLTREPTPHHALALAAWHATSLSLVHVNEDGTAAREPTCPWM